MIPDTDRGFALGDGLFETILADGGELVFWDEHCARLERGCDALGLPSPDRETLRDAAVAALSREGLQTTRAAVRLSWTAGSGGRGLDRPAEPKPNLIAVAAPAPFVDTPVRLATSSIRRNETSPTSRHKTLAYLDNVMARREALGRGADEALMLDSQGRIACAAAANIFWIEGGDLFTPSLNCGVLGGIMRDRVMARAGLTVTECEASLDRLRGAQAAFLTNSLIGVRTVSQVDGHTLGGETLVQAIRARL